jgi:ATP-dependent Clp protease adaptor protein ClpS
MPEMQEILEHIREGKKQSKKVKFSDIKKWNVIFYNDNKTTMEFVISVLVEIFNHTETKAKELTLQIHEDGSAVVGQYIYEIAEQKASETLTFASMNSYPLKVNIEKDA